MTDDKWPELDVISKEAQRLHKEVSRTAALRYAMAAVEPLLEHATDEMRVYMYKQVFNRVGSIAYQKKDFEVVDYELYELASDLPLFRGPPVPPDALERGDYFCVMGAAQTFGRLSRRPWPQLVAEQIGLPVLNLGRGGAGPEFFMHPTLLQLASKARFVVLQVMSGRSVGCEEFPGSRYIVVDSKVSETSRSDVLKDMWRRDRKLALRYVLKWNENYFQAYRELREEIDRPTALFWTSTRSPGDWKPENLLKSHLLGDFPQLVGRDLYKRIAALFDCNVRQVIEAVAEIPVSRVTGLPCGYIGGGAELKSGTEYYPSGESQALLASKIARWGAKISRETQPTAGG